LANHLNDQSAEERNQLAQACIQDFQTALTSPDDLELSQTNDSEYHHEFRNGAIMPSSNDHLRDQQLQLLNLQPHEIEHALSAAKSLLKDVEDAFRSIDRNDAEELADVAVTLARLFLLSLQSVQYQLEGMVVNGNNNERRPSPQIEILEETSHPTTTNRTTTKASQRKRKELQRIRILWPPLGPQVASACQWGKEVAFQKPLLTAALGLTLWPAALGTVVVGGSIVVADSVLQNIYNHFEHSQGPLVKQIECGAAQAWQTARLSLVTGKLVTKQSVRVLQHQVDRQGGWPQVGHNVAGMALDRACHPIETAGMAWNAAAWGAGVVSDTFQQLIQQHQDEEEESAAQRLHQ
jgi:hypothetical protein